MQCIPSRGRPLVAAGLVAAALTASLGPGGAGAAGVPCSDPVTAAAVRAAPASLRFGITPGVQTGQLGIGPIPPRTAAPFVRQVAALRALRPSGRPFVLRLHRFFWSGGRPEERRFLALAHRYTRAGFQVELQLRYHPAAAQEGHVAAWVAYVRDVVRRFGADRGVVGLQVTNEVNLTFSPDSSDGGFRGAREALVRGVIAAHDEAHRRGYHQLGIGFNWAYRGAPDADVAYWHDLRARGGNRFIRAVDWLGVDAYPGTFLPTASTQAQLRDGLLTALATARCLATTAGFPRTTPLHIEETGWPTSATRTEAEQADAARVLLDTAHRYAGTYGLRDMRWFNLRDGDSTRPGFQTRYGLLRDDYSRKPAFGVVRDRFSRYSMRAEP